MSSRGQRDDLDDDEAEAAREGDAGKGGGGVGKGVRRRCRVIEIVTLSSLWWLEEGRRWTSAYGCSKVDSTSD